MFGSPSNPTLMGMVVPHFGIHDPGFDSDYAPDDSNNPSDFTEIPLNNTVFTEIPSAITMEKPPSTAEPNDEIVYHSGPVLSEDSLPKSTSFEDEVNVSTAFKVQGVVNNGSPHRIFARTFIFYSNEILNEFEEICYTTHHMFRTLLKHLCCLVVLGHLLVYLLGSRTMWPSAVWSPLCIFFALYCGYAWAFHHPMAVLSQNGFKVFYVAGDAYVLRRCGTDRWNPADIPEFKKCITSHLKYRLQAE